MFSSSSFYFQEEVDEAVETKEKPLVGTLVDAGVVQSPVSAVGEVDQSDVHQVLAAVDWAALIAVQARVI